MLEQENSLSKNNNNYNHDKGKQDRLVSLLDLNKTREREVV